MSTATGLAYLSDRTSIDCVCGNSGGFTIRRTDRHGLKFRYKICLECGHVRTSNPLSTESARRFYTSSDYRSMYFPGETPKDVLLRKTPKPNTVSPLLRYVEQLQIETGNLIEWGCGGGWNLVPFRDAGWSVQGFDYDRPYIELGRSLLGLQLDEIPTEGSGTQVDQPDVIVLNHVLEHAIDPKALLQRLHNLCSDATTLVVGVPLLETIPIWHWRDFFHVAHIHYFSAESLVRVATQSGFQITHSDIQNGMFSLKKNAAVDSSPPSKNAVLRSSILLMKGFIEPPYRTRQLIRQTLAAFRLLHLARRLKKRVAG